MILERWQQIDKLFHSTLEFAPEKRAAFLAQACSGDTDLHHEVESLVAALEQDGSFLEAPAYEVAPEFVVESLAGLIAGQQIGPYKILSPLATGGMGEVYLAHDSRLGRKIALKLLPSDFARDQYRVRRFAQEARAASALNHPNVCVIHEIGQTKDGRHFIAMEHIDGITLRQRILQGALPLTEALFVAEQIAAALAAAHAAGVVHRDVKPENIMLRRDGYVKVLDFGLAKLNESVSGPPDTNGEAVSQVHTEPGTQMGTVRYMSPEHLRERPVDERADIWSFGVVLYEMLTGVTPFEARSRNDVIATILKRRPKFAFGDDVPVQYRNIVAKALNKSRHERYQTVDDLAADLKGLRRELKGETSAESLTVENVVTVRNPITTRNALASPRAHRRESQPFATTAHWSTALTYVSQTAGHILGGVKQHPAATVFGGFAVVLVLLLGVYSSGILNPPAGSARPSAITVTPLTNSGQSVCAAISPDGKMFAHVERKDGMQQLLIANIATAGTSVVVPPSDMQYRGIVFSPDASYLYLTTGARNDSGVLYQVAVPGGVPVKIKEEVDSPITFSPAADRFAFVRHKRATGEYSLVAAKIDGTEESVIGTRRDGATFSLWGPAWSPDGLTIVCGSGKWEKGYYMTLSGFDVASGQERPIGNRRWALIAQVNWLADQTELIVSAREQSTSPYQLWRISYPDAVPLRMTHDTTEYERISVSRDGEKMVALQNQQNSKIWVAPEGDEIHARLITSNIGVTYGLDWASTGKISFSAMAGKNVNISSIDPDGAHQVPLTVNSGDNYTPATSPDGRLIAFASNRNGSLNIWLMNAKDGSDPQQLTFTDGNSYPSFSPDGQWVLYDNQSGGAPSVWKVRVDGGTPVRLIDHARMPVVSPDNKSIAFRHYEDGRSPQIGILPWQDAQPPRLLPIPIMDGQRVQWTPKGQALTYIDVIDGVYNVWKYDLASGSRRQLTNFGTDQIFAYAWSADFKQLACLRGAEVRNVTLIKREVNQ
jgi:serine/threonine protein kinase/Tol biopolymer transport system component